MYTSRDQRDQRHRRTEIYIVQLGMLMAEHQLDWCDTHPTLCETERQDYRRHLQRLLAKHRRDLRTKRQAYADVYGVRATVRRYIHRLRGYRREPDPTPPRPIGGTP